jgi:hypothetical protein
MKVILLMIIISHLAIFSEGQNRSLNIGFVSLYSCRHLQRNDETFESFVEVNVTLNGVPSISEKSKLGRIMSNTFKITYNTLASEYADPLNRRVESVQIASATFQQAGTPDNQSTSKGKFRYRVTGTCRACPSKSSLLVSHVKVNVRSMYMPSDSSYFCFVIRKMMQLSANLLTCENKQRVRC